MRDFTNILEFQLHFKNSLKESIDKEFFKNIGIYIKPQSQANKDLILLESRYNAAVKKEMRGLATQEVSDVSLTTFVNNAFYFIDSIKEKDIHLTYKAALLAFAKQQQQFHDENNKHNLGASKAWSILKYVIQNLEIDEEEDFGELQLVNVNRQKSQEQYWEIFNERVEDRIPFQFYFINACPSQQPQSLAERFIYELIDYYLDEDDEGILLERNDKNTRIRFEELPQGPVLKISQRKFEKYFSSRFDLGKKKLKDFITNELSNFGNYEYITTVFELNASKWNKSTRQYLEWIIETFEAKDETPTFIFFFVLYMKDAHIQLSTKYKNIVDTLEGLSVKYNESVSLLSDIRPVEKMYVEDWIRDRGERNQTKIDEVLEILHYTMPTEPKRKRYEKEGKLDMSDIEIFQQEVYDVVNNDD